MLSWFLHLRCCHATRKFLKIFATGQAVMNLLGQAIAILRNTAQTLVKTRCSAFEIGIANGSLGLAQVAFLS
jgi:hypothetical protein